MTFHNAIKYIKNAANGSAQSVKFERVRLLCEYLGDPQKRIRYVRLAGNNGKTLCGGMLVSILKKANIRAGYLAMPIRADIRENIVIDSTPISMEDTVKYTQKAVEAIARINTALKASAISEDGTLLPDPEPFMPTSNELLLAIALTAFCDKDCELCLIESDHAGNDPSLFMPAPFSTVICGTIPSDDKKEIARIRSYVTRGVQEIVSAPQNQDAYKILSDTCAAVNCRLTLALKSATTVERLSLRETEFSYKGNRYSLNLCGKFQTVNAAVVLETAEMLERRGFAVSEDAIRGGLARLDIHSRFEVISSTPFIIADSTHTPIAIETVCDSMADFKQITGSEVRLCLPKGELLGLYYNALVSRGYTVRDIVTLDEERSAEVDDLPCSVTHCKTVKATAKASLAELGKDTVLLISGRSSFTERIRYEILGILGF